jgi:glycosyltransferase involved in cell wall biosynthesis
VARRSIGTGVRFRQTLPFPRRLLPYRYNAATAQTELERCLARTLSAGTAQTPAIYLWPDISLALIDELKLRGYILIREMVNSHRASAKAILDEAYARLGSPPLHNIDARSAEAERAALDRMDYIFCPNEMVARSVLTENGLPEARLLRTSYGWDPERIRATHAILPPVAGVTLLFVGSICVRKGAHRLLDLWVRSGIKGRLVLAGAMEPLIADRFRAHLSRDDVVVLDYVKDVGALYRSADVFVFPTLEEGGPMVTFEAQGAGLPALTTPMGRAGVVEDGVTGFVRDPYDDDGFLAAMDELSNSQRLRARMGNAAKSAAQHFTWENVGLRRRQQMLESVALPG